MHGFISWLRLRTRKSTAERAGVILEVAIGLPVILTLLAGLIDLGRWLDQYYIVSRVAYESARYAGSLEDLECGANTYKYGEVYPTATIQAQVVVRVNDMLRRHNLHDGSEIALNFDGAGATPANWVHVTIRTRYKPMFRVFSILSSAGARAESPYLFVHSHGTGC